MRLLPAVALMFVFMVLPAIGAPGNEVRITEHDNFISVANEKVELLLDARSGFFRQIRNKQTGIEHKPADDGVWPFGVWVGTRLKPEQMRAEIRSDGAQKMSYAVEPGPGGRKRLLLTYPMLFDNASHQPTGVGLGVSIELAPGSDYFVIRTEIANGGPLWLTRFYAGKGKLLTGDRSSEKEQVYISSRGGHAKGGFKPVSLGLPTYSWGWMYYSGENGGIGTAYVNKAGVFADEGSFPWGNCTVAAPAHLHGTSAVGILTANTRGILRLHRLFHEGLGPGSVIQVEGASDIAGRWADANQAYQHPGLAYTLPFKRFFQFIDVRAPDAAVNKSVNEALAQGNVLMFNLDRAKPITNFAPLKRYAAVRSELEAAGAPGYPEGFRDTIGLKTSTKDLVAKAFSSENGVTVIYYATSALGGEIAVDGPAIGEPRLGMQAFQVQLKKDELGFRVLSATGTKNRNGSGRKVAAPRSERARATSTEARTK